jgi:hypothetical protein
MTLYKRAVMWCKFHRGQAAFARKHGFAKARLQSIQEALRFRAMRKIYKPARK